MIEQADDLAGLGVSSWANTVQKQADLLKPSADDKNLIIIDGNNVGYRYLKRKNFSSFSDDYIRTVESLAKSYGCKDIIVAFDYGKSEYRKAMFPEYKGNRLPPTPEEEEHFKMFFAELNSVSDAIPYQVFKLFGVEADDIITYLTLQLKDHYPHIWIVSSDRDLYQLMTDNVSIFNLFSRKELSKKWLWDEKGLTPEEHKLSKIIQGDTGDNIRGIEGIGEKRGEDLAKTYKTISNLLSKLPLPGKSQYIRNLNAGKDLLLRNEKLINLTGHIREIIGFGTNGENNLLALNQFCDDIRKTYPKYKIDKVELKGQKEMTMMHLSKLDKMTDTEEKPK
jgi:5'-3' exonuclease